MILHKDLHQKTIFIVYIDLYTYQTFPMPHGKVRFFIYGKNHAMQSENSQRY